MRIDVNGQIVEGERTDFKPVEEPWSVYKLADGTTIKLKLVVSDVMRVNQDGPEPQYIVKSSNVMSVAPADPAGEVH